MARRSIASAFTDHGAWGAMTLQIWAFGQAAARRQHFAAKSEPVGYAAGIMTWLIAGSVFVAVKLGISEMPPWTFCCARALIAGLILLPFVSSHYRDMIVLLRRRWPEAVFIGAIGLGLTQGVTFEALSYTSAINVGIIFALAPMATMLLARVVLGEAMNGWQGVGFAVAFIGIVTIAVHGSLAILLGLKIGIGDLFAFCAILLFAGYTVLLKRAKFELPTLPLVAVLLFAGAASALPFSLWEITRGEHAHLARIGYLALAYASVVGGTLMYFLYNYSIAVLGAARAGTLVYTQMIFATFFAWLILGEQLAWYHFVGGSLVVVGIILVTLLRPKTPAAART
jgi:drug/metabolite transporter (DMT)-like permease